jgi:transposase InsO family protein
VAQPFPTDGSRRVAAQVRRAPSRRLVNRKRARRVLRHMGVLRRTRPRTQPTTTSRPGFRRFPNPDEIWGGELTYVRLGAEFIDLAMSMEVVTRAMRGWQLGRTLGQELPLRALQRALAPHTPVMHHRAQGLPSAAPQSIHVVPAAGLQSRMAAVGEPRPHGDAARVIRTIQEEESALAEVP